MSMLSKINGFIFRSKEDLNPEGRYIHMDGSIYGSNGIRRILSVPYHQASATLAVLGAAAYALSFPMAARQNAFIECLPFELGTAVVANSVTWLFFNRRLPVSKGAVIDKKGCLTTHPAAAIKMASHYKECSFSNVVVSAAIYVSKGLLFHDWISPYPAFVLSAAVWQWRAARKLSKGEWTIQTTPPKLEFKKAVTATMVAQAAPTFG